MKDHFGEFQAFSPRKDHFGERSFWWMFKLAQTTSSKFEKMECFENVNAISDYVGGQEWVRMLQSSDSIQN